MTSFAFILGVVPLVIATGAGAEMRRTLGMAVFSGMLGVTLFGIFLTPVFFYVIQWFGRTPAAGPGGKSRRPSRRRASGPAVDAGCHFSWTWVGPFGAVSTLVTCSSEQTTIWSASGSAITRRVRVRAAQPG